ncbi:MAG: GDSL-type esterase/lipase family protein [Candidatus Saccharimonadales bacterium]
MKIFLAILFVILIFFAARLGELYTQLARYQKYWNNSNLKPVTQKDFVYIALGDSAAQGIGASTPLKGYVGLIAEELQKDQRKNVKVINLSKSGAKIADVLQTQLPLYEEFGLRNKHLITIEIGANDIISFNSKKFEKEMDELMVRLPKNTITSDIPSFAGSRYAKYENRVLEANKITNKLAAKHNFVPAKLHERVAANHSFRTFAADLFHPSDYGYKNNWLPAFMDRINSGF